VENTHSTGVDVIGMLKWSIATGAKYHENFFVTKTKTNVFAGFWYYN